MNPKEIGVIVTAYTNMLCCKFEDFHEYVELKLNRPVWTHEMGTAEVTKQIKEAAKDDFLKLAKWCSTYENT